jgi:hypothetical protein
VQAGRVALLPLGCLCSRDWANDSVTDAGSVCMSTSCGRAELARILKLLRLLCPAILLGPVSNSADVLQTGTSVKKVIQADFCGHHNVFIYLQYRSLVAML